VLIHAPLYAAVRALAPEPRARFRRLVERLRTGEWGGGVRVKKLRGCAKPVYEARHDAGDRILFTVANTAARDAGGALRPHVQLWDLVAHDRVIGRARRVNPSAEAEFLDFPELEAEPIGEPPPHPAAFFAELEPAEPGAEAGVLELVLAPESARLSGGEEITGAVRWYVLPEHLVVDEGRWQDLMDRGGEELELKLTEEQYAVVRAPGPVLLSGSAGSGKTTIAVHRLAAAAEGPAQRALYVTYSRWLLDHARRLFGDVLTARGARPGIVPEFLTVHDLYRSLVAGAGGTPAERVADYPEFARWYSGVFRREDTALAWEEIRGIVKGASLDPGRPLLPRDEYEALGRKRAPAFVAERPRLHQVARRWQEHLDAQRLADEIDLCRLALRAVPPDGMYDHVVCDEAQDLAEVQVELLLRLLRGRALGGLFLAGDPQQVINPCGFRWAEVRSRIRDRFMGQGRAVPDLHVLTRNFRSVRGLVELANEVLAFKRDRTGRSDGDEAEEAMAVGAAPILVTGDEADLVAAIRGFGPRCAVVAGTPDTRTRLQASLETTRVFTVVEAKGLEFDVAILWGVSAADPEPWRRLLDPALALREDPACRRALHHLYVAVTRARRHLAVYEPPGAPPVWTAERFAARLDPEPPASLTRLFVRSAEPGEWRREGEYFLERGRHRQAAECFRRAGDARREAESLALHHEAAGEPALAAARWLDLGEPARAARCLEEARDYVAAAREWSRAGDESGARRCGARGAELEGRWAAAAEVWETLEAWGDAARCWASTGQRRRQARCLAVAATKVGQLAEAARRWEEIEDWDQAAGAWRAAGREREACGAEARRHEASNRWEEAAGAWQEAGDPRQALRCRALGEEAAGRWEAAASIWEEVGDYGAAIDAWRRAGQPAESRRCAVRRDLAEGRFLRAAEALEEVGDFAEAAAAWTRADGAGQQPSIVRPLPLPPAATRAWCDGGRPARLAPAGPRRGGRGAGRAVLHGSLVRGLVCLARAAEEAGRLAEAAAAWRKLKDEEQVLRCRVALFERAGDLAGAAQLLEGKGRHQAAIERWLAAGRGADASRCEALLHEKRGRLEQAAAAWAALGDSIRAARCRAALAFRNEDYDRAASEFQAAGDPTMAVTARVLSAKLRADYDAADRAVTEAGMQHLRPVLLGDRRAWLTVARALAASRARRSKAAHRPRSAQGSLFGTDAGPETAPARGPRGRIGRRQGAAVAPRDVDAVLAAVRRTTGLTCEEIAAATGIATSAVKPILVRLIESGALRKTGRTRGTRYRSG
jgi:tetratricopeptide (TPR) repeat protein